jgi:hypothetical protein
MALATLQRAVAIHCEREDEGSLFIVAGDTFDTSHPPAAHIYDVGCVLTWARYCAILVGNHDQVSNAPRDNAASPLDNRDTGVVFEVPTGWDDAWLVPYGHHLTDTTPPPGTKLAVAHQGIEDETTPPFLRAEKNLKVGTCYEWQRDHNIPVVLSGDWHAKRVWLNGALAKGTDFKVEPGVFLTGQIGALCPTGFDNPGLEDYGWMVEYNPEHGVVSWLPVPGPRFLKTEYLDVANRFVLDAKAANCVPFVQYVGPKVPAQCEEWRTVTPISKSVGGVVTAAKDVASDSNLAEAIHDYTIRLPQEVREDVRSELKKHLGVS